MTVLLEYFATTTSDFYMHEQGNFCNFWSIRIIVII